MAYAAGIDDTSPAYLDTTRDGGVVAHPLFLVGPEWPVVLDAGRLAPDTLTRAEARAGLHVRHDVVLHRLVRPGDVLATTATVRSVPAHRAGRRRGPPPHHHRPAGRAGGLDRLRHALPRRGRGRRARRRPRGRPPPARSSSGAGPDGFDEPGGGAAHA